MLNAEWLTQRMCREQFKATGSRARAHAASLDPIALRSDYFGLEPPLASSTHGLLLVEPTPLPDIAHIGIDVRV